MRGILWIITLGALAGLMSACEPADDAAGPTASSRLRLGFLPVDEQRVDVYLDSALLSEHVSGVWWSAYQRVDTGTHRLTVEAPGAEFPVLYDSTFRLMPDAHYTIVITGEWAGLVGHLIADTSASIPSQVCLRAVHLQQGDSIRFLGESSRAVLFDALLPSGAMTGYQPLAELTHVSVAVWPMFLGPELDLYYDDSSNVVAAAGHVYSLYAFGSAKFLDRARRIRCALVEDAVDEG